MVTSNFYEDLLPNFQGNCQNNAGSFKSLGVSVLVERSLSRIGVCAPTEIQRLAIPVALKGADVLACAKTGSGKTLAYVVPVVERLMSRPSATRATPRALVIVPTRELASQVNEVFSKLGSVNLRVALITGGESYVAQKSALRSGVDVVVCTPGRIIDHILNSPSFCLKDIELFVLDEADRLLDDNFKDQLEEIVKHSSKGRQTLLFSATMNDEVNELASLALKCPVKVFADQSSTTVDTLSQEYVKVRNDDAVAKEACASLLCKNEEGKTILIFCETKSESQRLCVILNLMGLRSGEMHGNLTQPERNRQLEAFKSNDTNILVATSLASRGLDFKEVDVVVSLNAPKSLQEYVHRVGRTARAGKQGRSVTLVGPSDRKCWRTIVKSLNKEFAKCPLEKERVAEFEGRIHDLEASIRNELKNNKAKRELAEARTEIERTKNIIKYEEEIFSRPKRTYIKKKGGKNSRRTRFVESTPPKSQKQKVVDKAHLKTQYVDAKRAKKSGKPKRMRLT